MLIARLIKIIFTFVIALSILFPPLLPEKPIKVSAKSNQSTGPLIAKNAELIPFPPTGTFETSRAPEGTFIITPGGLFVDYWDLHWSDDGGRRWKAMSDSPCEEGSIPYAAVVSPFFDQDHTLLTASHAARNSICISNDAGRTWHEPQSPPIGPFRSMAISPAFNKDGIVFAGVSADDGASLLRSNDRGEHWSNINYPSVSAAVYQIVISPRYSSDHTLFVRLNDGSVWRSGDDGSSWVYLVGGSFSRTSFIEKIQAVPAPSNQMALFAIDGAVMAVSYDQGSTWNVLQYISVNNFTVPEDVLTSKVIFASIDIDPTRDNIIVSTDLGATWTVLDHLRYAKLPVFSPNFKSDHTLYLTHQNVFYKSLNLGVTLEKITDPVLNPHENKVLQVLATPILNPGLVLAKCEDASKGITWSLFQSQDGGYQWNQVSLPEEPDSPFYMTLSPKYATDHLVFVSINNSLYQWNPIINIWSLLNNQMPTGDNTQIRISPNYAIDHTIWIGNHLRGLFRSTNNGKSWTQMTSFEPSVTDLELSPGYPADPTLFISVFNDGVYRSENNGATWTLLSIPDNSSSNHTIELSPTYTKDHILFAGVVDASVGKLFRSNDKGATWKDITAGLPMDFMKSLSISPRYSQDQTLMVGMDYYGTFISEDGGSTWFKHGFARSSYPAALTYEKSLLIPLVASSGNIYRYGWPQLTYPSTADIFFNLYGNETGLLNKTLVLQGKDPGNPLSWSIKSNASWLSTAQTSGVLPGSVKLQVDINSIPIPSETNLTLTLYLSYKQKLTIPIKVAVREMSPPIFLPVITK